MNSTTDSSGHIRGFDRPVLSPPAEAHGTWATAAKRIYRYFSIAVLLALALVGVRRREISYRGWPLADRGADGSVNTALQRVLGAPRLAEPLSHWLAKLPLDRPVLAVAPPNHTAAIVTADLISYLAWPRRVVVSCQSFGPSDSPPVGDPGKYSAIALCYLPVPAGVVHRKTFAPPLTFISRQPFSE